MLETKCSDGGSNLKLALIGTHGVGKTTLVYEVCSLLKKAHHNVELVTEVARQSPFPVNAETTLSGQLWILHAQIAAELDININTVSNLLNAIAKKINSESGLNIAISSRRLL